LHLQQLQINQSRQDSSDFAGGSLHVVCGWFKLGRMLFRCFAVALLLASLPGCSPRREAQVDEQRNPYFIEGKERIGTRDYKGAIAAFEKALEVNPRSALAHFELGVLYEQHSDQREDDYVAALYHYNQVVRLRPHTYPADNARQRIASCKQELVRSQSMAPVYQQTIRELDRLKDENQQLRRQVELLQAQEASRFVAPAGITSTQASREQSGLSSRDTPILVATNATGSVERSAPASRRAGRTHTIKAGETAFSIARAYRIRTEALLAANPGLNPRKLKIGDTINIPAP
jgi:tetratricopeptide (TPR) repeat protein